MRNVIGGFIIVGDSNMSEFVTYLKVGTATLCCL